MSKHVRARHVVAVVIAVSGLAALGLRAADGEKDSTADAPVAAAAAAAPEPRFFEMRTYHAAPGKLDALNARFRNHTTKLFKKHGMENVGYWTPAPDPDGDKDQTAADNDKANTLVYILAYPSKDACEKSWQAFREDPEWIKAKAESEKDGPLVQKVERVFLNPTDYSAIK